MPDVRVLAVVNGLGTGGAERSLAESIGPLRQRGVDVEVACFFRRQEGVEDQVRAETTVHLISGRHWPERVRSLRRLVKSAQPDLVHTMLFESDVAGRISAVGSGPPVLTSLVNTSYGPERLADPRVARWKLETVRGIDSVTGRLLTRHFHALTETVARSASDQLHIPMNRITVVPRGRDRLRLGSPTQARRSRVRREHGIDERTPMILCVGRQEFQKGQRHLVEAARQFKSSAMPPRVFLAGRSGAETDELRLLISRHDLTDVVTLLGHVENIPDLLAATDIFVFPSLFEGLGGSLIEAMAMGVPTVTTDLAVTREVAGGAAVYVPAADPLKLGESILELLADEPRRREMSEAGVARFDSNYSFDTVMDRMAEMMSTVVATSR